jgi:hypothetical protein
VRVPRRYYRLRNYTEYCLLNQLQKPPKHVETLHDVTEQVIVVHKFSFIHHAYVRAVALGSLHKPNVDVWRREGGCHW